MSKQEQLIEYITADLVDFIMKDELERVYELVKNGSFNNMTTMNMSIYKLYNEGKISKETALSYSDNKSELEKNIYKAQQILTLFDISVKVSVL